MAFNIFNAGLGGMEAGQRAFDRSYALTDKGFKDAAARKAGMALASGDRQGAMQAMGGEGELDAVRQMQLDQGREDQQAYSNKRQEGLDADKKRADLAAATLEAFEHVAKLKTPAERRQAMKHPVWGLVGITPEAVDQQPDSAFSDENTAQFGETLKYTFHNLGAGGIGRSDSGGGYETVREPDPKMMSVAGGATLTVGGKPVYTAPKSYAPPRPRAAPSSSGGADPALAAIEAELRRRGAL